MALYRNRKTHEIVDAITFWHDGGKMIVHYVGTYLNPPELRVDTQTEFHLQHEKVPPRDEPFRELHVHFPDSLDGTRILLDALKERGII